MENILEAQGIVKDYAGHRALNKVDVAIPRGSIFGLLGPNGAGKTSLIRIINQITGPDEGQILLGGEPLRPEHVERIGYLPEERGLYKKMKVGEQALYFARLKGMSTAEAKRKLKEWFERMDIIDWWEKKVEDLSKGMAQKVQFITTVLHEPELLIFDEPFSGFDPINANIIKDEILRLKDHGSTVIFSTHRMESVEELCEYIALINRSEKILDGKLSDIKKQYKSGKYQVEYEGNLPDSLPFEVLENINGKATIQAGLNHSPNQLISGLLPHVTIHNFNEVIPSVNDIFIQTVQNSGNHE
jgi:ABC-2 type transport system ATP-binding protein